MTSSLVGSEMCIRDRLRVWPRDTRKERATALNLAHAQEVDTHGKPLLFDGSKAHQALLAHGDRYSVL
eukprot:10208134-Prorocentrum_lima.AAC.1